MCIDIMRSVVFLIGIISGFHYGEGSGIQSLEHLQKMAANITSTDEFLRKFVRIGTNPVSGLDSLKQTARDDGRWTVADDVPDAIFDGCSPRNMTHKFEHRTLTNGTVVVYWPPCVMAVKCGGCFINDMMQCEPTGFKTKAVKVTKHTLVAPGSPYLQFQGFEVVPIEEHTSCAPRCKVKAHDCNAMQEYLQFECRCRCRNEDSFQCQPGQFFDRSLCACRCEHQVTCGPAAVFDQGTCRCRLLSSSEVMLAGGMSNEDYLDLLARMSTTTSSTTTTTIPSTTTPTTTPAGPCSHLTCFGNWYPRLLFNGQCQCMLNLFRLPGRKRRSSKSMVNEVW